MDPLELDRLNALAKSELIHLAPQLDINFNIDKEKELVDNPAMLTPPPVILTPLQE